MLFAALAIKGVAILRMWDAAVRPLDGLALQPCTTRVAGLTVKFRCVPLKFLEAEADILY